MIRVAAVGDVHMALGGEGRYRAAMADLGDRADMLLLAGDLTNYGTIEEARVVADEFRELPVPVIAILGNHDYHDDRPEEVASILRDSGIHVLEGSAVVIPVEEKRVGVAGAKGFGGGFSGACGSSFGEREMKDFMDHSRYSAGTLANALHALDADYRVALTHYAPVPDTLSGEPPELYPFLGSHLLAEAIDSSEVDLAVHGHAHYGSERGETPKGVPVRNAAEPVLGAAFTVYELDAAR